MKGSKDGFKAEIFHQKCDDQSNILILIKSDKGNIFGGFTTKKWSSEKYNSSDD